MRYKRLNHYRTHLMKHFLLIALTIIFFITIVGNLSVKYYFNDYLDNQIAEANLQIVSSVESLLFEGSLDYQTLKALSSSGNVYMRLLDAQENVLLETDSSKGHGMGSGMGYGRMGNQSQTQLQTSSLVFETYPLDDNISDTHLTLEIGRPNRQFSSAVESQFIYALNLIFAATLIIAIIFSVLYAIYQSKKITTPLSTLIENTKLIEEQAYQDFDPISSDFIEINNLNLSLTKLNEKLMNQEALRKRLSTDIAHELRNPLSILRSHIEAFVDGVWEPSEEKLLKCNDEILRLTRLIDELNELSVIENSLKLNRQPNDMAKTLKSTIDSFEIILEEREINIAVKIPETQPMSYDEPRMAQVFINLLSNAIKYSPDSSRITVELTVETFSISDQGIGISKEDLPFIYERFYRSDASRNRKTGGLGIGLSITKAICDAHGYKLSATSEFGKGSIFSINFG